MNKTWRIILDQEHSGAYNMACDEALLEGYSHAGVPTLRVYGWNVPCISLGYNQRAKQVLSAQSILPVVRRMTGGASILHQDEITYSIILSVKDLCLSKNVKESYVALSSFLIDFYDTLGLKAVFADNIPCRKTESYGSYCYSNCHPYDLVVNGKKIGGNAQRRKKEIIFQHGSIPLSLNRQFIKKEINPCPNLDEATCLRELMNKEFDFNFLKHVLAGSFCRRFSVSYKNTGLSYYESGMIIQLIEGKYAKKEWNLYRNEKTALAS
ncbi:MAG: lipoate--protein ligase family protein [Candidatus Omnitrophota bacterium]